MPSREQMKADNANATSRSTANRARRDAQRVRKDKMSAALNNATSTKDKREIRKQFSIDTNKASSQTQNMMGVNEDSNLRGDDVFKPEYVEIAEAGGDASLAGIEIIWADQDESFISATDILANYDGQNYWSVVFGVSNREFTKAITFDSTQELWDDVGGDQTEYRLRVKTLNDTLDDPAPTQISAYGQYREESLCVDGRIVTNLIKIS